MKTDVAEPGNIDDYIAGFPENVRKILGIVREVIRETAPDARETIKYGMPTFVLNGNLVHFAAFRNHVGFYPAPRTAEEFRDELTRYDGTKSSLHLPFDEPIPVDLIRRIVAFRVRRNTERSTEKR